jgi:hypothetical protein
MAKSPHTGGERGIVPDWRAIGITRRLEVHDRPVDLGIYREGCEKILAGITATPNNIGQFGSKSLMLEIALHAVAGVAGFPGTLTLDKMMTDRKHLVSTEVNKLLDATKGSRNAARDKCLLLLMFRHGLRVSEACGLVLSQVDIESRILHVTRLKAGLSTTHPLRGDELKAIKAWLAIRAKMEPETDAFFISERRRSAARPPGL